MGCSTSKLDDEEAVQLCKDRKKFVKQAIEQRTRFVSGHIAYIRSLKRVSAALREYVEGYEPREFSLDSFITPPFTPVKKTTPHFISINSKSFSPIPIQSSTPSSTLKVNYLRSGGNMAVLLEERPQSPETVRVEAYSPVHQFGMDGFFSMQSSPMNSSSFYSYSPNNRPSIPSASPQTSQWDFFWNPFSSLDYYGYPTSSSLDQAVMDDEIRGLRQVREEEGIPELEDETELEESYNHRVNETDERRKVDQNFSKEEVVIEDVDEDEEEEDEMDSATESDHEVECKECCANGRVEVSRVQNAGIVGTTSSQETALKEQERKEETPGFTVYVNRKPTSMEEVIKDLETQFMIVCNSANEVSTLLEATKAPHLSSSNELTAMKMLNPVALFRSASSRSSSSRFIVNTSSSREEEEGYESSSEVPEEPCMFAGNHQMTLDRLYAWEKKLYDEVRSGEKVRIACEKKCNQLRDQDVKGEDPSSVEKTRATIRDLHTQIKVSIHSIEAISKRIETLRDEELQPQLLELVQGLARMWKVMAECHRSQKRTLDEAKLLLAGIPSKLDAKRYSTMSVMEPNRLSRSAANLETELRNWRGCFDTWITSQRSYVHAITGWLLRCVRSHPDASKLPFSPRRSMGTLPIFGLCIQWSSFLDAIREMPVLDGLDFFAAGMGSLYAQNQQREDSRRTPVGSKRFGSSEESGGNMELVEVGEVEEVMTVEKMAEVGIRVLCAGMSVAMSSLTEFAFSSAEGYDELVKLWESANVHNSS